jgi:hypothetical protein
MSVAASERASAVPIAYRLFSHTNSTGSFHSAARFNDSWNSPSATAPSPKKQAAMPPRSCSCSASARPTASGSAPPTMALPP